MAKAGSVIFDPVFGRGLVDLSVVHSVYGMQYGLFKKVTGQVAFTFVDSSVREGNGNQILGWNLNGFIDPFRVDAVPSAGSGCPGGVKWTTLLKVITRSELDTSIDGGQYYPIWMQ